MFASASRVPSQPCLKPSDERPIASISAAALDRRLAGVLDHHRNFTTFLLSFALLPFDTSIETAPIDISCFEDSGDGADGVQLRVVTSAPTIASSLPR
jgi:hypothetical protein